MTDFSLNDFLGFASTTKYFTIKNFEEVCDSATILSDVEEKIKQQLMIILYKFIIYSDDLFTIKEGKEELYEMIYNYVIEREKVQDEILGVTSMSVDEQIELFDVVICDDNNLQNANSQNINNLQQKKRKVTKKEYTLDNYFKTYCLKYFGKFGPKIYKKVKRDLQNTIDNYEDSKNAYSEEDKENDSDEDDIEEIEYERYSVLVKDYKSIKELILKSFDYNYYLFDGFYENINLLFIGYVIILEYFTELILNYDENIISTRRMELAITKNEELKDTVRNMIYFPEIDLNYLYGSNLNEVPLINNNIIDCNDKNSFCTIPNELHSIILRHFDSFNELLQMRLVCKNWNYLILKDQEIWKHLTYHSLIKERIFTMIDSSFTLQEMEQILQNSLHYCNDKISTQIRLVKHYFTNNDWFNIYYLLIKSNLNLLKVLQKEIQKYFKNNIDGNVLNNLFRIGVYNNFIDYRLYNLNNNQNGRIKIFEKPEVSKNNLTQFNMVTANEEYPVFIGQINCKEFSSFLSARYLPKSGVIYFFYFYEKGAKVFYLNYDNEETNVIPKKEGLLFHYNENLDICFNHNNYFIDLILSNGNKNHKMANLIKTTTEQKTTYCGACSDFDLYKFRCRDEKVKFELKEDEIMLFATRTILWDEDVYVIFTIKRNDLKNCVFDNTKMRVIDFEYDP